METEIDFGGGPILTHSHSAERDLHALAHDVG